VNPLPWLTIRCPYNSPVALTLDYQEPNSTKGIEVTYRSGPPRVPRDTNRSGLAGCLAVVWFAFCGLVALGFLGVIVWAVVTLVLWVTQ
jgi:hypothetical protein